MALVFHRKQLKYSLVEEAPNEIAIKVSQDDEIIETKRDFSSIGEARQYIREHFKELDRIEGAAY